MPRWFSWIAWAFLAMMGAVIPLPDAGTAAAQSPDAQNQAEELADDDSTPAPTVEPAEESASDEEEAVPDKPAARTPTRRGPIVRSSMEVSSLLRPPGEDRYEAPIDWQTIPPWRQTAFYGVRARGTFFVFVIDCSGSMANDLRLTRAKQELRRCVASLRFPQRYYVIFYNDRPVPMPGGVPRSAEHRDTRSTFSWLSSVHAEGGTDPRGAMDLGLGLRPDAVFLLSDGEFSTGTAAAIAARNGPSVPIHCIDLSGGAGATSLRQIAEDSGGRYTHRP